MVILFWDIVVRNCLWLWFQFLQWYFDGDCFVLCFSHVVWKLSRSYWWWLFWKVRQILWWWFWKCVLLRNCHGVRDGEFLFFLCCFDCVFPTLVLKMDSGPIHSLTGLLQYIAGDFFKLFCSMRKIKLTLWYNQPLTMFTHGFRNQKLWHTLNFPQIFSVPARTTRLQSTKKNSNNIFFLVNILFHSARLPDYNQPKTPTTFFSFMFSKPVSDVTATKT